MLIIIDVFVMLPCPFIGIFTNDQLLIELDKFFVFYIKLLFDPSFI